MKSNLNGQCEPEFHSFSPLVIKFPATICINYFCSDCQVVCHTNTTIKCKVTNIFYLTKAKHVLIAFGWSGGGWFKLVSAYSLSHNTIQSSKPSEIYCARHQPNTA